MAHEVGHYEFQYDKSMQPTYQYKKGFDANGQLTGYAEERQRTINEAVDFGRRTEAAAKVNEIILINDIKSKMTDASGLPLDIGLGRESKNYSTYEGLYNTYAAAPSLKNKISMLDSIGTVFGLNEKPNDPTGTKNITYETNWKQSASSGFEKSWRMKNGYYDYWDGKLSEAQKLYDNRFARKTDPTYVNNPGNMKILDSYLQQGQLDILKYTKNRGPK